MDYADEGLNFSDSPGEVNTIQLLHSMQIWVKKMVVPCLLEEGHDLTHTKES